MRRAALVLAFVLAGCLAGTPEAASPPPEEPSPTAIHWRTQEELGTVVLDFVVRGEGTDECKVSGYGAGSQEDESDFRFFLEWRDGGLGGLAGSYGDSGPYAEVAGTSTRQPQAGSDLGGGGGFGGGSLDGEGEYMIVGPRLGPKAYWNGTAAAFEASCEQAGSLGIVAATRGPAQLVHPARFTQGTTLYGQSGLRVQHEAVLELTTTAPTRLDFWVLGLGCTQQGQLDVSGPATGAWDFGERSFRLQGPAGTYRLALTQAVAGCEWMGVVHEPAPFDWQAGLHPDPVDLE